MTPWRECRDFARSAGKSLFEALVPAGYVSFFETTVGKHSFDGFASAIPAFNDRHQNRDPRLVPPIPVISADDGARIRRELEAAAATGAEHVVVYGWNEYFENAVVEPTREQGSLLFESCRQTLAALKMS